MSSTRSMPRAALAVLALAALGAAAYLLLPGEPGPARSAPPDAPNIIVVESDDQTSAQFTRKAMPHTFRLLVDRGTLFEQGIAPPPLCCPSRAAFLTGQYPHNNGVFQNNPGFEALREPGNVLPAWLSAAGYRSAFVGKYLNGTRRVLGHEPAPGWDVWFDLVDKSYWGVRFSDGGELVEAGRREYTTTRLTERAVEVVDESAGSEEPLFLWLAHRAPHVSQDATRICPRRSAKPLPADFRRTPVPRLPSNPAFDEPDVSDKPNRIRALPRLDPQQQQRLRRQFRCAVASMAEVDRGVRQLWRALKRNGMASDTVIVFVSDNGQMYGEHRIVERKGQLYEETARVPLAIRVPHKELGERPAARVREQVSKLDLTATLLELAGVEPCLDADRCRRLDGRSAVGLLRGIRSGFPADRGVLIEQGDDEGCKLAAIRTDRWTFGLNLRLRDDGSCVVRDRELYDRRRDPHQLRNIAGKSPLAAELEQRLQALRGCSGTRGERPCE